jgi:hypothetical protein
MTIEKEPSILPLSYSRKKNTRHSDPLSGILTFFQALVARSKNSLELASRPEILKK